MLYKTPKLEPVPLDGAPPLSICLKLPKSQLPVSSPSKCLIHGNLAASRSSARSIHGSVDSSVDVAALAKVVGHLLVQVIRRLLRARNATGLAASGATLAGRCSLGRCCCRCSSLDGSLVSSLGTNLGFAGICQPVESEDVGLHSCDLRNAIAKRFGNHDRRLFGTKKHFNLEDS